MFFSIGVIIRGWNNPVKSMLSYEDNYSQQNTIIPILSFEKKYLNNYLYQPHSLILFLWTNTTINVKYFSNIIISHLYLQNIIFLTSTDVLTSADHTFEVLQCDINNVPFSVPSRDFVTFFSINDLKKKFKEFCTKTSSF